MGSSFVDFLQNLNMLHLHLSTTHKDMVPPAFSVEEVGRRHARPAPGRGCMCVATVVAAAPQQGPAICMACMSHVCISMQAVGYKFAAPTIHGCRCVLRMLRDSDGLHCPLSPCRECGRVPPPTRHWCAQVTPESCVLHYMSTRAGLTHFAIGLVKGAAEALYKMVVEVVIVEAKDEGAEHDVSGAPVQAPERARESTCLLSSGYDNAGICAAHACALHVLHGLVDPNCICSQDLRLPRCFTYPIGCLARPPPPAHPPAPHTQVFLIRFPPQPDLLQASSSAATCRLAIDPPTLFHLFPFHMVLDKEGRLVQVGWWWGWGRAGKARTQHVGSTIAGSRWKKAHLGRMQVLYTHTPGS